MAKNKSEKVNDFIRNIKIATPETMDYVVFLDNDKERNKYVSRIEKIVRSSKEYRDYIAFLKEHIGLDHCVFFQNVTNGSSKKNRITIEIHHEPLTLYDIVNTVVNKYIDTGTPLNDLLIADEVMQLHYENKVGLVPLSKTAHQVVHNSTKLFVPLNMCYGNYSEFLNEYDPYIDEEIIQKIERKVDQTAGLTMEAFDAITKEFSYIEVSGYNEVEKMDLKNAKNIA